MRGSDQFIKEKSGKAFQPFRFKFIAIAITTLRQQN
jgi:hypothetical protein